MDLSIDTSTTLLEPSMTLKRKIFRYATTELEESLNRQVGTLITKTDLCDEYFHLMSQAKKKVTALCVEYTTDYDCTPFIKAIFNIFSRVVLNEPNIDTVSQCKEAISNLQITSIPGCYPSVGEEIQERTGAFLKLEEQEKTLLFFNQYYDSIKNKKTTPRIKQHNLQLSLFIFMQKSLLSVLEEYSLKDIEDFIQQEETLNTKSIVIAILDSTLEYLTPHLENPTNIHLNKKHFLEHIQRQEDDLDLYELETTLELLEPPLLSPKSVADATFTKRSKPTGQGKNQALKDKVKAEREEMLHSEWNKKFGTFESVLQEFKDKENKDEN